MKKKLIIMLVCIISLVGISIVASTFSQQHKNKGTANISLSETGDKTKEDKATVDETQRFSVSENANELEKKKVLYRYPITYELDEGIKQKVISLYGSASNVIKTQNDVVTYTDHEDGDEASYRLEIGEAEFHYIRFRTEGEKTTEEADMQEMALSKLEECGVTQVYDIRYKDTVRNLANHYCQIQYEMYLDDVPVSNGMHGYQGEETDAIGASFEVEITDDGIFRDICVNRSFFVDSDNKKQVKIVTDATYEEMLKYVENYKSQFEDEQEYEASQIQSARWVYMPEMSGEGKWELVPEIELVCETKTISKSGGNITARVKEIFYLDVTTGEFYVGTSEVL